MGDSKLQYEGSYYSTVGKDNVKLPAEEAVGAISKLDELTGKRTTNIYTEEQLDAAIQASEGPDKKVFSEALEDMYKHMELGTELKQINDISELPKQAPTPSPGLDLGSPSPAP